MRQVKMTLKDKEHTKNNDWEHPTQMYYKQDVKEAVLKFTKWINGDNVTLKPEGLELINEELDKIFGDFEK